MKRRLEGKVAIVTGGGTGIGEAIAKKFAREGARVIVNGLPGDPIRDVVATIQREGFEAMPYAGDVADEQHARVRRSGGQAVRQARRPREQRRRLPRQRRDRRHPDRIV